MPTPLWPLLATLAMQTLATMAAFSVPAIAPAIAADLGLPGGSVGFFVAGIYGVGMLSALLSPGFIQRHGPVRVSQAVLAAVIAMLLTAAIGTETALIASAILLGLAYGATAPASTHLLVPHTPPHIFNLVMSIRQVGVPLGGVLAGLIVPPLALALGWRGALLAELPAVLILLVLLQIPRPRWDAARNPRLRLTRAALLQPLRLWQQSPPLRRLSLASFIYTGVQLAFIAFMTVHLTRNAGFDLVAAGWTLAAYQIAGAITRPALGWLADRHIPAARLLAWLGPAMCLAALATAAFSPAWHAWQILAVCLLAGASGSGFTGLAYAEYARLGGTRRTEATGLGSAAMFAGVLVIPPLFGTLATALDSFSPSYVILAALALSAGLLLRRSP